MDGAGKDKIATQQVSLKNLPADGRQKICIVERWIDNKRRHAFTSQLLIDHPRIFLGQDMLNAGGKSKVDGLFT